MPNRKLQLSGQIVLRFSAEEPGFIHINDLPLAEVARTYFTEGRDPGNLVDLGQGKITIELELPEPSKYLPDQTDFLGEEKSNVGDVS